MRVCTHTALGQDGEVPRMRSFMNTEARLNNPLQAQSIIDHIRQQIQYEIDNCCQILPSSFHRDAQGLLFTLAGARIYSVMAVFN